MCYIVLMNGIPAPLFETTDEAAEAQALDQAEADLSSGRTVAHEAVKTWLLSWGTEKELPAPDAPVPDR